MTNTIRRLLRGACLAAFVLTLPASAGALSLSGSYLAAMQADFRNDYETTAAYLSRALTADPDNIALLQNAIVANVATGDILASARLAERLAARMPQNQVAALVRVARSELADLLDEAGESDRFRDMVDALLAGRPREPEEQADEG